MAGLDAEGLLAMTETSYIELVQWTGEQARSDKPGKLKPLTEGKRDTGQAQHSGAKAYRRILSTASVGGYRFSLVCQMRST